MKLTRETLYKIHKTIKELDTKIYNKYFLMACYANKKTLESFVIEIETSAQGIITPEFVTFKNSYDSLVAEFKQTPSDELDNKIRELVDSNITVIEEHQKRDSAFVSWLKEEVEVELKQISFDNIPEELSKDVFDSLVVLIQE
jgi:hypothetical protein